MRTKVRIKSTTYERIMAQSTPDELAAPNSAEFQPDGTVTLSIDNYILSRLMAIDSDLDDALNTLLDRASPRH